MVEHAPRDMEQWMKSVERRLQSASRAAANLPFTYNEKLKGDILADKLRHPTAPVEITWQTAFYTPDGLSTQYARLMVDFPDVTKATDGTDIPIKEYELWIRDDTTNYLQATTDSAAGLAAPGLTIPNLASTPAMVAKSAQSAGPYRRAVVSAESSLRVDGLIPGTIYTFRVRAIGRFTTAPGEWSAEFQAQMDEDTTPPSQPTVPVLTVSRGTVTVRWDGLSVNGSMPSDFSHLIVAYGPSSSPINEELRFFRGGGTTVLSDLPYYTPVFVRFAAVDYAGNRSPWSEQAVASTTPLVDKDVILAEIDAATTKIKNIGAEAIKDGEILASKLADGAVSLGKLDAAAAAAVQAGADAMTVLGPLQVDVDGARSRLETAEADMVSSKGRLDTAESSLGTLNGTTLPQLRTDLDAARTTLAPLPGQITANTTAVNAAKGRLDTLDSTTLPALNTSLTDARTRLATAETTLAPLPGKVTQAQSDLTTAFGQLNTVDTRIDTAKQAALASSAADAKAKADAAQAAALAAAATDAQTKADAAKAAALAGAATDATGKADAAKAAALTAAATDAQTKADAAKAAAISAAATTAQSKADAAQAAAIAAAAADATTKSDAAKAAALTAAAADAKSKADAAQAAAITAAATDAKAKADAAQAAALAEAATTAQSKADAAKNAAIAAAATDATGKANAAQTAALTAAATDAQTKADAAKNAAVAAAATTAQSKADAAQAAAIAAAATDAQSKADAALNAAKADATGKANAAQQAAITAAAADAQTKADAVRLIANQAMAAAVNVIADPSFEAVPTAWPVDTTHSIDASTARTGTKSYKVGFVAPAELRRNLCPYPNSEDAAGFAGKWNSAGITPVRDTTQFHSGTASTRITMAGVNGQGAYLGGWPGAATGNTTYTLSAWVKGPAGQQLQLNFDPSPDGTSWSVQTSTIHTLTGAWQRVAVTATTGPTTTKIAIGFKCNTAWSGDLFVDDIMYELGSSPTPWFDGSSAQTGAVSYSWLGTPNLSASVEMSQPVRAGQIQVTPVIPVSLGQVWRRRLWYKTTADYNGSSGGGKFRISDQVNTFIDSEGFLAGKTSWTLMETEYTIPAGVSGIQLQLWGDHTIGGLWVDDLELTNITDAKAALAAAAAADAKAVTAQQAAGAAQGTANSALTMAGSKSKVYYDTNPPTGIATGDGDLWRQRDVANNIIGEWRWNGTPPAGAWTKTMISSDTISNLDVGKLTAGAATIDTAVANKMAVQIATIIQLNADRITAGKITSGQIDTPNLATALATIIQLNASAITAGTIATARLDVTALSASIATIIQLNADRITAGTIATARLNVTEIAASVATIIQLNADRIVSGTISTSRLDATTIAAATAAFQRVDVKNMFATSGTLDSAVITKLWADVVNSQKITSDMIVVSKGANLMPDPAATDMIGWGINGVGDPAATWAATGGKSNKGSVTITATATQQGIYYGVNRVERRFRLVPGGIYRFSAWAYASAAVPVGAARLYSKAFDENGNNQVVLTNVPGSEPWNKAIIPANTWTLVSGLMQMPDTSASLNAVFGAYKEGSYSTGTLKWSDFAVQQAMAGELIVDGSVTANKVATNAITAKNIVIGDFANLAFGSDFEDASLMPWTLDTAQSITTGQKKFGTSSLQLGPTAVTRQALFTNDLRTREGEQWYFKFWVYVDSAWNGTSGNSKFRIGDQATAYLAQISWDTVARNTWVPVELTYTVPAGVTALTLKITSDNAAGNAYIDDLQIRRVAEPSLIQNLGVEKLTATSATMSQAVIDKLWTDVVTSRKITTQMLAVGSLDNVIPDPTFSNAGGDWGGSGGIYSFPATEGYNASPAMKLAPSANQEGRYSRKVPVVAGADYRVNVWVKSDVDIPIGALGVYVKSTKVGGATVTGNQFTQTATILANTWTQISVVGAADPLAVSIEFGFFKQSTFSTGTVWFSNASATRMAGGELIVDGEVTAVKVATRTLTADKIKALELTANEIQANAIEADKIKAGAVVADKLEATLALVTEIAAGPVTGEHASMDPTGFKVYAVDPDDGSVDPVVNLGTSNADDYFQITDSSGQVLASMNKMGAVTGQTLEAKDALYYKGTELQETLDALPKGIIAWNQFPVPSGGWPTLGSAGGEVGLFEIGWETPEAAPRMYAVNVPPILIKSLSGATGRHGLVMRYTTDGSAPTVASSQIVGRSYSDGVPAGGYATGAFNNVLISSKNGPYIRVLISLIATVGSSIDGTLVEVSVDDKGLQVPMTAGSVTTGGVVPVSGGGAVAAPANPVVTKAVEYAPISGGIRSFLPNDSQYAYQPGKGYQGLSPAGYGNLRSMVAFPDVTGLIGGSNVTVNDIWVYMYFEHWYNNDGGFAKIGLHPNPTIPGTWNTTNTLQVTSPKIPKGAGRYVRLPNTTYAGFKTGAWKGFTLLGDPSYNTYGIMTSARLKIRYTK